MLLCYKIYSCFVIISGFDVCRWILWFSVLSGPGCSKLTTSLVNVSLNFQKLNSKYANIFCWKHVRSFCIAKASLIFFNKIFNVFGYIVIKHLTSWPLNYFVKLTMLWTTGPWYIITSRWQTFQIYCNNYFLALSLMNLCMASFINRVLIKWQIFIRNDKMNCSSHET